VCWHGEEQLGSTYTIMTRAGVSTNVELPSQSGEKDHDVTCWRLEVTVALERCWIRCNDELS
jgi:hypothetical protein